jgi:glutamate carboxypeptidase
MMRAMRLPALLAILSLPSLLAAAPAEAKKTPAPGLTKTELKLAQAVERRLPASLALLERVVDVNSGTFNEVGVREVGRHFRLELEDLHFQTTWVDGSSWGRAGHLVAEGGSKDPRRPKVVLVGHLDTVFEPDSPFQRFQRLDDSTATGPGVIDMKGGDVILLLALQALKDAGQLERLRVSVVLTGDEENMGRGTIEERNTSTGTSTQIPQPRGPERAALLEAGRGATAAIGFEDGDGDPRHVVVSRRGSTGWTLHVHGTPSHSSQVFSSDVGIGAIYETARILERFRDSLAFEPYLTFNPGLVLGGTSITHELDTGRGTAFGKSNVVAETTLVTGDLRALTLEQRARARDVMQNIVAESSPHTEARIVFDDSYPPLAPTDGNRRLLALVDQASRDLGLGPLEPVDPARAGAADVSFLAGTVPMVIDAMGLKGSGGHTVLETARLGTLAVQAKRVAVLLSRLAQGQAGR